MKASASVGNSCEYELMHTRDTIVLVEPNRTSVLTKAVQRAQNYLFPELRASESGGVNHMTRAQDMKLKQRMILFTFILFSVLVFIVLCSISIGLSPSGSRLHGVSHQLGITINVEELTERSKCPACFGVKLCPDIISGKVELSDWNKFRLSKLVNAKNVFYATWNGKGSQKQIVLKKLAHDHELEKLDRAICDRHGQDDCPVPDVVISLIGKYSHQIEDDQPIILHGEKIGTGSSVLLCPSHRKMDFLIQAATKFSRGQHRNTVLANALTMLLVNPEPLLLQAFPAKDGWPFPKYYGGCGRIVAEEYVGRSLTLYYNEPFNIRAQIAKQLLEMANKFGENPTNFILYLTDITPENFAFDEITNQVKVVDLEDIVMVDKEILIRSKVEDFNKLHVAESVPCNNGTGNSENLCFSYSVEQLCDRPVMDHNYYAICTGLLAPGALSDEFPEGLLHTIPDDLTKKFPNFAEILLKCKDPSLSQSQPQLNRVEAAQQLIKLLGEYLRN